MARVFFAFLVGVLALMASASPMPSPEEVDLQDVAVEVESEDSSETNDQDEHAVVQLKDMLQEFARSDKELKQHMIETMDAILTGQASLQNVGDAEGVNNRSSPGLALFTRQIVRTVQEINNSSNNIQLTQIIDELKTLNSVFKEYLSKLACPPPFVRLGSECFAVVLEDLPWDGARNRCLSMDADLAQPDDITALRLHLTANYPRKDRRNFWLGAVLNEKLWQWLSGELVDPNYWYTNEPSGNGVCLAMFDGWDHPLTDFPCENRRRAVCQRVIEH